MMDVDEMEGVVTEVTETVMEMTTEDDDVLPFRSKNIHDCALVSFPPLTPKYIMSNRS